MDDLERRFSQHTPSEAKIMAHKNVRSQCLRLARSLNGIPEGREKSLAMTNLEQTMFWANAAIARDDSPE